MWSGAALWSSARAASERRIKSSDEQLVVERLAEKPVRSHAECALAHARLVVGGDENNRQAASDGRKPPLHLEAVHPRHVDIENEEIARRVTDSRRNFHGPAF
jgi:hypothetical protein